MPAQRYDVVVLGAGPAGCTAAIALRRRGVPAVLLVDAGDTRSPRLGESIPPDSRLLLERIGVWNAFIASNPEPCLGSCSGWGSDELGFNDFLYNPHGPGWHLDRRRFDDLLLEGAAASGAAVVTKTALAHAEQGVDGSTHLTLRGADAQSVRAGFVVDATGRRALLARMMGARPRPRDRLSCAAAFVALPAESPLSRMTMLEAVEYGWWYVARLPGARAAVVLATDVDIMRERGLSEPAAWSAHLTRTRHVCATLEGATLLPERLIVRSASAFSLDRVTGHGWLAIGAAAAACDPISSAGIYRALATALHGAECIVAHAGGDQTAIARFQSTIDANVAQDERQSRYFYELEQRWPDAPFWRRRHAAARADNPLVNEIPLSRGAVNVHPDTLARAG